MSDYTMPSLCAKCGCEEPTETWQVKQSRVSISPWTILSIFARRVVYNTHTVSFTIPLCAKCKKEMAQALQMRAILQVVGVLIFVGVMLFLVVDSSTPPKIRELLPVVGAVVGLMLIFGSFFVTPNVVSYSGGYFRFANKAFQSRFASLNPRLVRRR